MKKLLLLTALLPGLAGAQTALAPFTIDGHVGHYNAPAKVYFDYTTGTTGSPDSAVLKDGVFRFAGKVDGPATVRMSLALNGEGKDWASYHGDVIYIYIGAENIRLTSKDSLAHATVTGSTVYNEFMAFNHFIGGSIMDIDKIANGEFNSATEEQKKDTTFFRKVDNHFRQMVRDRNAKELEFARTHPASFFSVIALAENTNNPQAAAQNKAVFAAIDSQWRNTPTGKQLAQRMDALTAIVPGSLAPDFTQNDTSGRPLTLSSLRGHYVLVDFWASWCSPCRAENPNLVKQYKLYGDKGFRVLQVSLDDKKEKWIKAIQQDSLPWLHVCDLKGWANEAGNLYAVTGVPASFLVDPQGKIVAVRLRGEELNEQLAAIYGK
jgi:thiol-disulfide isomerase/thioredoxin